MFIILKPLSAYVHLFIYQVTESVLRARYWFKYRRYSKWIGKDAHSGNSFGCRRRNSHIHKQLPTLGTFMYKVAWERREILIFSWDVERPCRVSDLDTAFKAKKVLSGQGNRRVSTRIRGVLYDGVETVGDKKQWSFYF